MTTSTPKQILLFRHAEKPSDKTNPGLAPSGQVRARNLAKYIPQNFGKPDFIFACAVSKDSNRPSLTVTPLAKALGLKLKNKIADNDFKKLARKLFTNSKYSGKLIVICWHHGNIPALASALNAPAHSYPSPWPENIFNLILNIDYSNNGEVKVTQITEPF